MKSYTNMLMKKNANEFQGQYYRLQDIDIQPDNFLSFADPSWGRISVTWSWHPAVANVASQTPLKFRCVECKP